LIVFFLFFTKDAGTFSSCSLLDGESKLEEVEVVVWLVFFTFSADAASIR
jgi:hypothetical protein